MLKKRNYILTVLLMSCLIIITSCSSSKNVKSKEVEEFTKSILDSNEKVKELSFYFQRPSLNAELIYNGDLDEEDFQLLINEFKTLVNIEFMQEIGDKYGNGARPESFDLYVYVDEKKDNNHEQTYDYKIYSEYNKTHVSDENPENIDGYKTWKTSGKHDS